MTDVFFSYSSKDRERVRPIRDALVAEGFDVFWDQEVPPGRNWDEWIRQHLDAARCAIVFWSAHSVKSDNVVHEATVAKSFGKLIPVLLDLIEAGQFPMGHYTTQALIIPPEGIAPATLLRLNAEVEAKAIRRWMRRKFAELEGRVATLTTARQQLEDNEAVLYRRVAELEGELESSRRERNRIQADLKSEQEKAAKIAPALNAEAEFARLKQENALLLERLRTADEQIQRHSEMAAEIRDNAKITEHAVQRSDQSMEGSQGEAKRSRNVFRRAWYLLNKPSVLLPTTIVGLLTIFWAPSEISRNHRLWLDTSAPADRVYRDLEAAWTFYSVLDFIVLILCTALWLLKIYRRAFKGARPSLPPK